MVSESQADNLISSQPKHFIPSPESASVQKALRVGIKSLRPKEVAGAFWDLVGSNHLKATTVED